MSGYVIDPGCILVAGYVLDPGYVLVAGVCIRSGMKGSSSSYNKVVDSS